MCDRDDFEEAFVATLGHDTLSWYMKQHRASEGGYNFTHEGLTGSANAAWWAWQAGRRLLVQQSNDANNLLQMEAPHVLH